MRLVIDASAAIWIALGQREAPMPEAEEVLAPDLFVVEVTNAAWKYHQLGGMALSRTEELLEDALDLANTLVSASALYLDAFAIARRAGHSVYDMFYLALARRQSAVLMTRDRKLERLAKELAIRVVP